MMTLALSMLVLCATVCSGGAVLLFGMTYAQEWAVHDFGQPRLVLLAAMTLTTAGAAAVWIGVAALTYPWGF